MCSGMCAEGRTRRLRCVMHYRGFSRLRAGLDVLCASLLNRVRRLVLVLVLVLKGDGGSIKRVMRGRVRKVFSSEWGLSCQM